MERGRDGVTVSVPNSSLEGYFFTREYWYILLRGSVLDRGRGVQIPEHRFLLYISLAGWR